MIRESTSETQGWKGYTIYQQQRLEKNYIPPESEFSTFTPEFPKQTVPSLNLDMSTNANKGFSWKSKTEQQTA